MLLYPYSGGVALTEAELERRFPRAYKYLSVYQDLLRARSSIVASGLHWFELVRKRDESWLTSPKLVTRDLVTRTSFAIDDRGSTFLVGGTAVVPLEPRYTLPLLGYMNSRTASEYLRELTPTFRGAFQKIEPRHLNSLPIPPWLAEYGDLAERIEAKVQIIVDGQFSSRTTERQIAEDEIDELIESAIVGDRTN